MDIPDDHRVTNLDGAQAKTTITSFRIIRALNAHGNAGVSELAEELEMAKGTIHKHLTTLRELGFVVKDEQGYRLSVSFLELGVAVRARMPIYDISHEPLQKLAEATGKVASLVIKEHGYGVYISRVTEESTSDIEIQEGERIPLHATASGKAILAYTPEEYRDQILEQNLQRFTKDTVTNRDDLYDELQRVYNNRIAHEHNEFRSNRVATAAPITDLNGDAVAAVTVSKFAEESDEKMTNPDVTSLLSSTADFVQNRYHIRSNEENL
ncbi:IclR family transcriptional regulator [Halobacteria archaeon AArc-m2/3/4]|uniref:IclR family transcriptional regulator n=1 Tax=Natronoglomus mannanivorans TaxID=2979990 RepID=A0ABT2QJE9_9EURY|nr:IclR family transcriptional regulator [Halobacteria archaeon AArc-m2/3/4]